MDFVLLMFEELLLDTGFPSGSVEKNPPANTGDSGSVPGSGRSPGEGDGYPLQHSCLENSMDREAWKATYSLWGCKESDTTEPLTLIRVQ